MPKLSRWFYIAVLSKEEGNRATNTELIGATLLQQKSF